MEVFLLLFLYIRVVSPSPFAVSRGLLGFGCASDAECQVRVRNSECDAHFLCKCREGHLPLRLDKCLPPAKLGDICLSDAQCHLADEDSSCEWIVPRIYGKCHGSPVSASVSVVRAASLGKPCLSSAECRVRDPHSRCAGGRCECKRVTPGCSAANTGCVAGTFQCGSGQCVSWYFVCDGERNCADGSDEEGCSGVRRGGCPPESFECGGGGGGCLSRSALCNGRWECPDGSDEANCYTGIPCDGRSFQCANGQCLPSYVFCNAVVDCVDGSDEDFAVCERGEGCPADSGFRCSNGRCRSSAVLCSGLDGCGDNSDEDRCTVCACAAPE